MSREELLELVNENEQKIWMVEPEVEKRTPGIIREWDEFAEELFNESEAEVWDDMDDETLALAFEKSNEIIKRL